jgi:DNA-binding response OmpR family regulator
MHAMRILVVEDYPPLRRSLSQGLRESGYAVDEAADGEEASTLVSSVPYDAIVLDLMLPKIDGLALLEEIRRQENPAGIVILTARDTVSDRVKGLDLGADDYLVKPFAFEELLARVRAVIRRRYRSPESTIQVDDLEIDPVARVVKRGGKPVALSAREYSLLEYLAARRGQVVTRAEIWDHVYDFASEPNSNVVDVYIGYLRRKIDQSEKRALIQTRRGLGYVLGERP